MLVFGVLAGPAADAEPLDPLPLRRVLVPPERVAAELERARQGTMVSMPRARFEALVQEAAQGRGGEGSRAAEAVSERRSGRTREVDIGKASGRPG